MTTVVDQVITIFDAVWKGDAAAKSSLKSLEQYRSVSSQVAVKHQQQAEQADSLKRSMMGLGATIGTGGQTAETAAAEFEVFNKQLVAAETEMEKLIPTTQTTGDKIKGMAANAAVAVAAFAAITMALKTTYAAVKKVYDAAAEGANLIQLRDSFNLLNATAMHTPDLLNDMVDASKNTISEMAAMEGVMTLVAGMSEQMTKNFAEAAPTLMEIAKAANKLNPTLGDTAFMFNSIARGIKRQEPRLLDNLGLNVKVAMASKMWADEMGVAVTAMSAEDKQQALLNETLRVGKLLIDQVGGSTESAADDFLELSAATDDYKNAWKEFIGGMKIGQSTISEKLREDEAELRAITLGTSAVDKGIISRKKYKDLMLSARAGNILYAEALEKLVELEERHLAIVISANNYDDLLGAQIDIPKYVEVEDDAVAKGNVGWEKRIVIWEGAEQEAVKLVKGLDGLITTEEGLEKQQNAVVESAEAAVEQIDDLIKSIREMDAATGDYAMAAYGAEKGSGLFNESISEIGESWIRVGGRTKEQNELLDDLQSAYDKAKDSTRDYEYGIRGFALTQEKANAKIDEGTAAMEFYRRQMEPLKDIQGDLVKKNTEGTWNQENINKAILEAGDAAGASATELVKYMLATGEITEAQAEAILEQSRMSEEIGKFGTAMKEGIPAGEIIADVEAIKTSIKDLNLDELLRGAIKEFRPIDASKFEEGIPIPEGHIVEVGTEEDPDTLIDQLEEINKEWVAIIETKGADVAQIEVDNLHASLQAIAKDWEARVNITTSGSIPSTGSGNPVPNQFGGPMQQGASYWVGERGPELFTPNVNGDLAPTGKTSGGGSIVVNNFNREAAAITATMMGLQRRAAIG